MNVHLKFLILIFSVFCLTGCSLINETAWTFYKEAKSVESGEIVALKNEMLQFTVPNGQYFLEQNKNAIELQTKFDLGHKYLIYTEPAIEGKLLDEYYSFLLNKLVRKKIVKDFEVIKSEKNKLKGQDAIYIESYIPEKRHKGFGGMTVIDRSTYTYLNYIFKYNGYVVWVYRSQAVWNDNSENLVSDNARQEFSKFVESIRLL